MRLFIAIQLPLAWKIALKQTTDELSRISCSGTFTQPENLHLTLAFLGETEKLSSIKTAMRQVQTPPFFIQTGQFGQFHRSGGDIWWLGLQPCVELQELHNQLSCALRHAGFILENRRFTPHLTLGRQIKLISPSSKKEFLQNPPVLSATVEKIHLMQSLREKGRLIYRCRDCVVL